MDAWLSTGPLVHASTLQLPPGPPPARLEELSEKRQGMVARVKAAQKERDSLAGDKEAAGAAAAPPHVDAVERGASMLAADPSPPARVAAWNRH